MRMMLKVSKPHHERMGQRRQPLARRARPRVGLEFLNFRPNRALEQRCVRLRSTLPYAVAYERCPCSLCST